MRNPTQKSPVTKAAKKKPDAAPSTRKPRQAACGRFRRDFCDQGLAGLLEGCRSDRTAMRRVGRQNCAILQCLEERGLITCEQCTTTPCVFQENLDQVCPAGSATEEGRTWRLVSLSPSRDTVAAASATARPRTKVPDRSVSRLRWYLAALEHFRQAGIRVVSSADLGTKVGVSPSLVRRDLCYFGQFGTPSRGYDVGELHKNILAVFEVVKERWLAWVGAERLRADPQVMEQFASHNWQIAAVFDPDPQTHGGEIGALRVLDLASLKKIMTNLDIDAAVLAVRDEEAQQVAAKLVEAGIEAILNLSSVPLTVPDRVAVQQADLATQLLLLSYRASLVTEEATE